MGPARIDDGAYNGSERNREQNTKAAHEGLQNLNNNHLFVEKGKERVILGSEQQHYRQGTADIG